MKKLIEKIKKAWNWLKEDSLAYLKDFFWKAYWENSWVWLHGLVAGIIAMILKIFPDMLSLSTSGFLLGGLSLVLVVAVGWEIFEYSTIKNKRKKVIDVYGSVKKYVADTFGDITFSLAIAFLVLI